MKLQPAISQGGEQPNLAKGATLEGEANLLKPGDEFCQVVFTSRKNAGLKVAKRVANDEQPERGTAQVIILGLCRLSLQNSTKLIHFRADKRSHHVPTLPW